MTNAARPQEPEPSAARPRLALHADSQFSFARRRWSSGVGNSTLASFSLMSGIFLLTQASATSGLVVQTALVGCFVSLLGVYFAEQAARQFGHLVIDSHGVQVHGGRLSFHLPWNELQGWRLNDNAINEPELPSLEVWRPFQKFPSEVPGGFLSADDHHKIRSLLTVWAPGKEKTQGL